MRFFIAVLLMCVTSVFATELPPLPVNAKPCEPAQIGDATGVWVYVASIDQPQTLFSAGDLKIETKPLPKAKEKDPAKAVFKIGELESKSFAYPGKWYHLAVSRHDGKVELFVNGEPDVGGDARTDILTSFKSALPARSIVTSGHRGINRFAPENTAVSYKESIAAHVPIGEMDLRLTKDNVLVLLHDATVDRTTNGKGPILEMTLEESRKLDAGSWKDKKYAGEKLPTVEEIANECRGKIVMMLDLKCTGLGKSLAELKQKLNYPSDGWILAPWEDQEGVELRKYLSDVPMIRLTSKPADVYDDAYFTKMKQIGFSGFSVNWINLPQSFIDAAHKNGMKVHTWTVNEPCELGGAVLAGVDGIVTDDPAATMKLVDQLTKR